MKRGTFERGTLGTAALLWWILRGFIPLQQSLQKCWCSKHEVSEAVTTVVWGSPMVSGLSSPRNLQSNNSAAQSFDAERGRAAAVIFPHLYSCISCTANNSVLSLFPGGLFLLLVFLFVMWKEFAADFQKYILLERSERCLDDVLVHVYYGWSFMFAAAGVPLVLLSGLLFFLVGRDIMDSLQ